MIKKIGILILALLALQSLYSKTTLRISGFSRNINLNYDLNGGAEIVQTLTIKHKGDAVDFFLAFQSGSSGQWNNRTVVNGGSILSYQIYKDSSKTEILKDIPDNPTSSEVLSGSFPLSSSFQFLTVSYSIYVPDGQFDIAGVYSDNFDVSLYSGNLAANALEESKNHSLKVTMPASLELSMTPAGGGFNDTSTSINMDFGTLMAGLNRSVDALVRTNAPYSVFILSDNGGKLIHIDSTIADTVPYTFRFNGSVTDLTAATPTQVISGAAITSFDGTRYPLEVTINDFAMAAKGYYSDNITITIQAQ